MQYQRKIWEENTKKWIIWKKNCPFCWEIIDEEKKLLIKETKFWTIRYNKFPYWWIKKHILLIPKRHIELSKELNQDELLELKKIYEFINEFYKKEKYFSFLRETFEWRSIKHLHYHYLPWNIHGSDFAKILHKQWYWTWKT